MSVFDEVYDTKIHADGSQTRRSCWIPGVVIKYYRQGCWGVAETPKPLSGVEFTQLDRETQILLRMGKFASRGV